MTLSALTGTYSAFLNATGDSRLQQTLTLPLVSKLTATWTVKLNLDMLFGPLIINPDYQTSFKVAVRDLDGTLLNNPPYQNPLPDNLSLTATHTHYMDLSAFAGKTIILSFEETGSMTSFDAAPAYAIIDNVTVNDGTNELVQNGDFETGDLTGWTVSTSEVQNITSGSRPVDGLDVKRSFYTVPNKLWARWVDVFKNNTAAKISTTISYETVLGAYDGTMSIIYSTPGTTNKALTSWDASGQIRDIGLVYGNAASVDFISYDGIDGSDTITVSYDITVPAGGRVAIVNFALMSGTDTGLTAELTVVDPGTGQFITETKAAEIDTEAANIVNNFWTDWQYRKGMTQEQINAISNFTRP